VVFEKLSAELVSTLDMAVTIWLFTQTALFEKVVFYQL